MKRLFTTIFVPALLLTSVAMAQDSSLPASPTPMQSPAAIEATSSPSNQPSMGSTQNMNKMATTVTRAAEMCETMMKKEMAAAPYKLAAGVGIGVLLLLALVLFVVLEVQWIIYWSGLLKAQKGGDRV